jgi:uncharacterized repeat protein (TIGR01451 family)
VISAKRVFSGSRRRRALIVLVLLALPAASLPAAAAAATPSPAWAISSTTSWPANFSPDDASGDNVYVVQATNTGSKDANGVANPITLTDVLPAGLTLNPAGGTSGAFDFRLFDEGSHFYPCDPGPPASCTAATTVHPGERLFMIVPVNVDPGAPPLVTNQVSVSGGGAAGASASAQTTISEEPVPFGIQSFESSLLDSGGAPEARAGSHPYQFRISAQFNTVPGQQAPPSENPRDIVADLPAGLVINPRATPVRCTEVQLETFVNGQSACPEASAVGLVHLTLGIHGFPNPSFTQPLYNMVPSQGRPAEFAFDVGGFGIFIHLLGRVRSDGDIGLSSDTLDTPQFAQMSGVSVDLWGDPSDPSHDFRRGSCANPANVVAGKTCPTQKSDIPFITMPSACSGPLAFKLKANSWQNPGDSVSAAVETEDEAGNPVDVSGCDKLAYAPLTETNLSTDQAESGTGLDFNLDFANDGWIGHAGLAEAMTKKAVVTLPEGVTINPSVGEGLGSCTPAQYKRETVNSVDGEGCPADSKLGSLHVDTPLLDDGIDGSAYLAQQDDPTTTTPGAENPFDTDIAIYMVLRNSDIGVLVKQELKVEPDPKTGQLVTSIDDIPQLPFSHFNFHFREGARAALVTPPACGRHTTVAKFYPWSEPNNPRTVKADFEITEGVGGGPCPPGGVPPFDPFFEAGSLNNNAKSYSPFHMRLVRHDGEQDMTKFSSILPPGVLGKLAGVSKCPDAAIEAARSKTGRQELNSPSCPANSLIGHTLAGAGVGDALTYVKGQLYLGGPYHGAPLSVVSVTPGLAGPFDAGTVVVRVALDLNPVTAEVEADGAASDPIPHILKGIVLKVRDLRVRVDRPEFIINPTSCDPSSAKATLFGGFLDVFSPADDVPVPLSTRYQAANCLNLGFKPHLKLNLRGGTRRGDNPGLKAVLRARPGDANIAGAQVTLPPSAFLQQEHIRTICTRVQYAADQCPKGSIYGRAKAVTPLLDEPVVGNVYLRSSSNNLPDLVIGLKGLVDVDISSRIDSKNGGIRNTFDVVPDAPVSEFTLTLQGGKKGLIVNSRNLCKGRISRANVRFRAQNGRARTLRPQMKPQCGGKASRNAKKR